MKQFYLTFSNDETVCFVPVGYIWTEDALDDLHVQFHKAGTDNYFPTRRKGMFVVRKTKNGPDILCKGMEMVASRPKRGFELKPAVLKSFWHSPNRV